MFLRGFYNELQIVEKHSYNSGLRAIIGEEFDLLLLDMSIPTYDISLEETGGRTRPFGGKDILEQIQRKKISCKVIVITQFEIFGEKRINLEQLKKELSVEFTNNYLGTVYYNPSSDIWTRELEEYLISL